MLFAPERDNPVRQSKSKDGEYSRVPVSRQGFSSRKMAEIRLGGSSPDGVCAKARKNVAVTQERWPKCPTLAGRTSRKLLVYKKLRVAKRFFRTLKSCKYLI